MRGLLPVLESKVMTLMYLRTNRTQADIATSRGVFYLTFSRAITAMTPIIAFVVQDWVAPLEEVSPGTAYVIDGSLIAVLVLVPAPGVALR